MKRMWINQPSTHQPWHHLDGQHVLVDDADNDGTYCTVYYLEGPVISQRMPVLALSLGWPTRKECYGKQVGISACKHL
jgi:hypothetical protein